MKLINGKFYQDGKPVPLEFGNWDQISIMNRALKRFNSLSKGGLEVEVSFSRDITGHVYFYCICGQSLAKHSDVDEEGDLEPLEGVIKCIRCNKVYEVFEEDGKLLAKFKEKN